MCKFNLPSHPIKFHPNDFFIPQHDLYYSILSKTKENEPKEKKSFEAYFRLHKKKIK